MLRVTQANGDEKLTSCRARAKGGGRLDGVQMLQLEGGRLSTRIRGVSRPEPTHDFVDRRHGICALFDLRLDSVRSRIEQSTLGVVLGPAAIAEATRRKQVGPLEMMKTFYIEMTRKAMIDLDAADGDG